ncbi:MAG: outer membrane beta-barrel protein [Blastocatellia bacterium]
MKAIFTLCLLFSISTIAAAQEHPKSEFYVGYSLLRTDSDSLDLLINNQPGSVRRHGSTLNGFNVSGGYSPTPWLGFIADVGGNYGTVDFSASVPGVNATFGVRSNFHTLLFGPQIFVRGKSATFFARGLAGAAFINQSLNFANQRGEMSETVFAAAAGAGADIIFTDRIAWRIGQVDYILTRFGDRKLLVNGQQLGSGSDTQHHFRFSTGFVFRNP